jgi:hypothetical protein
MCKENGPRGPFGLDFGVWKINWTNIICTCFWWSPIGCKCGSRWNNREDDLHLNEDLWNLLEDLKEKTRVQDISWRSSGRSTKKIAQRKEDRLYPVSRLDHEQQRLDREQGCVRGKRATSNWTEGIVRWRLSAQSVGRRNVHTFVCVCHGWTVRRCGRTPSQR